MKKILIATAAAAMIGVAQGESVYQVTASLKTTVGAYGTATETYNLGWDGTDFWYTDEAFTNWLDAATDPVTIKDTTLFTYKKVKGNSIPVPTAAGLENAEVLAALKIAALAYPLKSAGVYCYTFKDTDTTCYRIAGTIKATGYFTADGCLDALAPAVIDNFGASTCSKSTKAELYVADVSALIPNLVDKNWYPIEVLDNKKGERTITALALAGHGTYGKVYDAALGENEDGVTSISGYAVGTATQPDCVNCCKKNAPITVWNCCDIGDDLDTVVFGTFSIKYNAAMTKKL